MSANNPLAEPLVTVLHDLRDAKREALWIRAWFRAALDLLHEQHVEIELLREAQHRLLAEFREVRARQRTAA